MDDYKKNRLIGIIVISLILIYIIFTFIWNKYINYGVLRFTAESPYTVVFEDGEMLNCNEDLCVVKHKAKTFSYTAKKDKFGSLSEVVDLSFNERKNISLDFQLIPYVEESNKLSISDGIEEYLVEMDENASMQKLFRKSDINKRAIVYFNKSIVVDKMIAGVNNVVIIDENGVGYMVDILQNKKSEFVLNDILNIKDLVISESGLVAYSFNDENGVFLYKNGIIHDVLKHDESNKKRIYKWGKNDILFILDINANNNILLQKFDAKALTYSVIQFTGQIASDANISDFYVIGDNLSLYLIGETKKFRIFLENF